MRRGRCLSLSPSYNNNVEYESNIMIKIEIKIIVILKLLFLINEYNYEIYKKEMLAVIRGLEN